jgi:hypothetical protein
MNGKNTGVSAEPVLVVSQPIKTRIRKSRSGRISTNARGESMNIEEIKVNIAILEGSQIIELRNIAKAEILSRFAELEKYKTAFEPLWEYCVGERKNKIALELKIAELEKYENDTGDLISKIADRDAEIKKLEEQVERLKCCGNCFSDGEFCDFDKCAPQKYCARYTSDNLTRKERET